MSRDQFANDPNQSEALRILLGRAEARIRQCLRLVEEGVEVVDAATTSIEPGVRIEAGTVIEPNTTIRGETVIGKGCRIGPNAIIIDSRLGDEVKILSSVVESSTIESRVDVGPFSHLRPGTYLESGVHIGNFVEVKASRLGRDTRVGHFSYVGDAQVGAGVNIGAGTVTCNYDGVRKNRTVIGDGVFIGSDTMFVAPVTVGADAITGAGAVVTRDVPEGALVVGVPARERERKRDQRQVRKQLG